MKMLKKMSLAVALSLALVTSSYATIIINDGGIYNDFDVGVVDTLLGVTDSPNSGENTELEWVKTILGDGVSFVIKDEPDGGVPYFSTDVTTDVTNTNVYAFLTPSSSSHFLIKNSNFYALYENSVSLDWGVFDTSLLSSDFNLPDNDVSQYTISHVSTFEVDEPKSLILLGIGLIGLMGIGVKKK